MHTRPNNDYLHVAHTHTKNHSQELNNGDIMRFCVGVTLAPASRESFMHNNAE